MTSGSKKFVLLAGIIIVGALMAAILFRNKSLSEKKAKSVARMEEFPVTVSKAAMENTGETLEMTGNIYAGKDVDILSETQGRIVATYVESGDFVSSGKVLAKVDDELKKAALQTAEANYEKTKKDFERYEQLNKSKSVNDAQLEQARLAYRTAEAQLIIAKRQLSDTKITAPFPGFITSRMVDIGNVVNNGTKIANLVDISSLKVKLNVAEKDAFKLKEGDMVEASSDVYPGEIFKGRIRSISAKGDESHTYPVEIVIQNPPGNKLKAGMFARVKFSTIRKDESVVIPREALVGGIQAPKVFVLDNDVVRLRNIVAGSVLKDKIEVLSGLAPGEIIVTSGQINLKDNVKVTVSEAGL